MIELQKIEYGNRQLGRIKTECDSKITTVIGMKQKICLQESVIEEWKLEEELEGILTMTFKFHEAIRKHNLLNNYSHYQVQRDASGRPILVRIPD